MQTFKPILAFSRPFISSNRFLFATLQKPATCYYKVLNVSTTSTPKEIKKSYYDLAKKHHPDVLKSQESVSEEQFLLQDALFKKVTEAYSVLGDAEKRKSYDTLVFGENVDRDFSNQDDYNHWSKTDDKANMRETLKQYKDYKDFLKNYESHQKNHEARSHLFREEGFKEMHEKHGIDYNHFEEGDNPDGEMNREYEVYRERFYERYWDTKVNEAYFSQPASTRAWITFKKVSDFYRDSILLWLGLGGFFVVYNAYTTSKASQRR